MEFQNVVTIARPVGAVFAFVSNLENVPSWNYAIAETRKTSPGPAGIGSTYRQVRSLPSRSEEELRVVELEPDRRFAFHGDLGPFMGTMTYEFEEVGDGTRLTNTAQLEGRGVMRIAASIAGSRVRDAVGDNLRTLQGILEREAR